MLGSGHLSRLTSTTQMIFDEFDAFDANDVLLVDECAQIPHASVSKASMP
jgi:hypothetical protein